MKNIICKVPLSTILRAEGIEGKTIRRVCKIAGVREGGPWLAGGSLVRLFTGEPDADFDIFYNSAKEAREMRDIYAKTHRIDYGDDPYDFYNFNHEGLNIQGIMFRYSKSIEDLLDTFAFNCTMMGTDGKYFYFHPLAMNDAIRRTLRFNDNAITEYKKQLVKYTKRYEARGFRLTQLSKLMIDIRIAEQKVPQLVLGASY